MDAAEQTQTPPPRVFISYSHDSGEHADRVLALAQQLRRDGIEVELDQFHQNELQHWPRWCEEQLRPDNSDFVLCVCTAQYKRRVEGKVAADVGKGVFWEGALIYNYLYNAKGNPRFVPVLLDDANAVDIPLVLDGYDRYGVKLFGLDDTHSEYAKLYRLLTRRSGIEKEKVGAIQKLPPLPEEERRTDFISLIECLLVEVSGVKSDTEKILSILGNRPPPASSTERPHNLPPWMAPEYFIGRHEELQILSFGLRISIRDAVVRPHVIYGGGGVGKSRLAIQTAWLIYLKGECNMAFFVSATTPVELATQLSSLDAPSLLNIYGNLKPPEELQTRKKAVIEALRTKAGRWVLILDNADSEQARDSVIQLFKELADGRFIVTSRREDWPRALVRKVAVNVFSREDAVACLLSQYWKKEPSLAAFSELAHELGCLPLALALAASYMESFRITPQRYLREWKQKQETFLNFVAKDVDYGCSLLAAFKVSYDCLSTSATALLRHLAWIAPEPFPRTQLENSEVLKMTISAEIPAALAELQMLSLVAIEDESLSLHRLVLDCARTIMSEQMRHDSLLLMSACVELMLPPPEWNEVGWRQWEQLAAHVRTLLYHLDECQMESSAAGIMNGFGPWLCHRAQYTEAEPLMRRVLAIHEASHGPRVAIDLNNLAQLLQATNRLAEAEPLMRRALAIDEKSFGPDHPKVAIDFNNLAQLLQATNRLSEAELLMRRALAIDEKSGPEDPRVAIDLNNLAQLLKATDRLPEAESLMRRALAIDQRSLEPEDPRIAIRLNNLALLLQVTKRLSEAEPFMRRALEIHKKSYGPEHPSVAIDLSNLALLLQDTNRPAEAEPLMRQALAIDQKSFGAIRLNNLAQLLVATNRLSEPSGNQGTAS
jgi:tetratricopeptide (TPR) repeat protein